MMTIYFLWVQRIDTQELRQAVFDIGVPIMGTLIWEYPNSILNKIITTSKCNSSFLISVTWYEHNNKKQNNIIVMCSLFGFHNHNLESSLCYRLFGCNANLALFSPLTINVNFFILYQPLTLSVLSTTLFFIISKHILKTSSLRRVTYIQSS